MKNNIKMVAVDLDGTLLRDDKTVSDFTVDTLRKCKEKGIKIVYATGRGASAETITPKGLFDGKITMNGAVCCIGDNLIYKRAVDIEIARELLLTCNKHGFMAAAESGDCHYTNFTVLPEWTIISRHVRADFAMLTGHFDKLYVITRGIGEVETLAPLMPKDLYMVIGHEGGLAQIMHVDATKAKAIAALAEHWSIRMSEVAAFGDELNDVDMVVDCGYGVAMGNAVDEIKNCARYKCGTNNEDGIAQWLSENLLTAEDEG